MNEFVLLGALFVTALIVCAIFRPADLMRDE